MERSPAEFVDFVKRAEGFSPTVYDDVGHPAVGYGHRLAEGEDFSGGISQAQADELLLGDLTTAIGDARRVAGEFGAEWGDLSSSQQMKLTERAFNLGGDFHREQLADGRTGFPKWTAAVLSGDTEAELAEHHRFSNDLPLTARNDAYEAFFHGAQPREEKPDLESLLGSAEFRGLSPEQQVGRLADASPLFRQLHAQDPERAAQWASEKADAFDPDFWESLEGGFDLGVGAAQWSLANAAMIAEELGLENDFDDSWRAAAEINFLDGENKIGSDWYDQVAALLGGLPGGMAVPAAATAAAAYALPALGVGGATAAALAMPVGFGAAGALSAADRGWVEAGKRGLVDAALGAIYPATAHLGRASRFAIEGAAAYAVSEQDEPTRRAIEAASFGVLAGIPGRRAPFEVMQRLGVKDRTPQQTAAVVESERSMHAEMQSKEAARAVGLDEAMREYAAMTKAEHPMTVRPQDRPPWEMQAIREQKSPAPGDNRSIGDHSSSKSGSFSPGEEWVEHRVFSNSEEYHAPLIGDGFKRAGEVIAPLSKAFEIPVQPGLGTESRRRAKGLAGFWRQHTRELHVDRRRNVQTAAHEIGHDLSLRGGPLSRLHAGKEYRADMERLSEIGGQMKAPMDPETGLIQRNAIMEMWRNGDVPEDLVHIPELLSVSYDRYSATQGIAEMFRLWTTNNRAYGGDVDIAAKFPAMHRELEAWKKGLPDKQRKAVEQFQKDAHEHLSMSAEAAMASAMGADADPAAVLSDRVTRFRQSYTDDLSGIYNLEQRVFGGITPDGPYQAARNLRGLGEAAERMAMNGAPTWVKDPKGGAMIRYTGDSLRDIFSRAKIRSGRQLDQAMRYTVARQALELKLQGREKLFSDQEIAAGIALGKGRPEFVQFHHDLKAFASKMADFGEGAGLYNSKQRENWQRAEFAFSFFREMGERAARGDPSASVLAGDRPVHTLRGSDRNLRDPFQNLIETHARTMKLALENRAKEKLLDVIQRAEGGGRFGEMVQRVPDIREVKVKQIRDAALTELGRAFPHLRLSERQKMINDLFPEERYLETLTMHMGNHAPWGSDIMTVLRGGEPVHYRVRDPMLLRSLQAMRRPQLTGPERVWSNLRRLKQRFITLAPGFMAANFARDVGMASIMSRTGNFHLQKSLNGLWSALRKDQHYQDYIANGGGAAGIGESFQSVRGKVLRHAQRQGFDPRRIILDAVSVHRFLDEVSSAVEMASRLGEYKAARKQGARALHAAYMGREVATDFSMRGDNAKMNFLSNTVPFFNAMIAGSDRYARGIALDPSHRAATAIKTGAVAVSGMALYMINRQIPQYMDLPDWDKWGYWHFYADKWEGDERARVKEGRFAGQLDYHHFKMPKLWEVGIISSMAERVLQGMLDDEEEDIANLGSDLGHLAAMNVGLNLNDRAFPLPLPVGAGLALEMYSNRVSFTGNPIETQAMANMDHFLRQRPGSPKVYGELANFLNEVPHAPGILKSPARAEALMRGMFGEFAYMGAALADEMLYPGGPDRRIDQMPVITRFYEGPAKYSRQEKEFWDRYEGLKQAAGSMRELATNPARADQFETWISKPENVKRVQMESIYSDQLEAVREIRQRMEMIQDGVLGYTPAEARRELDRAREHMRTIMAATNRLARDLGKEPPR